MNTRFSYRKISILIPVVFVFASLLILAIFLNIWKTPVSSRRGPQIYTAEIVNEFPHDRNAFTQVRSILLSDFEFRKNVIWLGI